MKKVLKGEVLSNECIAKDVYRIVIEAPGLTGMKAGQFVNIYLDDKSMLLPRPISICDAEENQVTLVYRVVGGGTKLLSEYITGQEIRVSTPLGNGNFIEGVEKGGKFDSYEGKTVVVVGGGIGVPPMLLLAKNLKAKGANVVAAIGFQDEPFLVEELEKYCSEVHVATDSGSVGFHGNAVQMIKEKNILGEEYFSCGPKVMLRALSDYCVEKGVPCQVSLEERMGCGYGACVGCTCKVKVETEHGIEIVQKGVCKHGPVFYGEEVAWDE